MFFELNCSYYIRRGKSIRGKKAKREGNRTGLRAISYSIRFHGQSSIALRGDGDEKETGNLWNLVGLVRESF